MKREDLGLAVLGAAGLAAFFGLYSTAFPQASVSLEVTRSEAVEAARAFLGERGAHLAGYRQAVLFTGDDIALTFLQRTLGVEEASRWAREEVDIWSWDLRWFRPQETEEWLAWVGLDGSIIGFRHIVEETAAGADLTEEEALGVAEAFLAERGIDLGGWERVEASSEKLDNRTDHRFAWERRDSDIVWRPDDAEAGTGKVRLALRVQGDAVAGFSRLLDVPEEFRRRQSQVLSVGQLLAFGALGITALLAFVAIGIAIARVRKGDVRWGPSISLGVVTGVLFLLFNVMSWPQLLFAYPTEIQWFAFVGLFVIVAVLLTAVYGAIVLFTVAAGESMARQLFPRSLVGFVEAARGKLLHPSIAAASLRGYALAFIFIGYLTTFYLFARAYLGAWLPAEGPYSQIFNFYWPFLAPLALSLVAAISEETTYRLFGISLIKRISGFLGDTGSTTLALVVPAAIWAFGHSTYPVYPVYVRGIELTLGGVLFGLAFLRWGLVTCIVAHYVVDAFLIGLPLLSTGNTTYVVSGIIAVGLALVPAAIGLVARRSAPPAAAEVHG